MKNKVMVAVLFVSAVGSAVAFAAGDWSSAERKAEDFKREQEDLKRLTPEEAKTIVEHICKAEEDERRSAASEISSRVKSKVDSKVDALESLKKDALRQLDDVLGDASLKERHDKAKELKGDVERRWETVTRMAKSLRGSNHPVVSFMLDEGKTQHNNWQTSSSNCDVYEFHTNAGVADCIKDCTVIEIKPKNDRAINKGKGQARSYAEDLNNNKSTREKLNQRNSKFEKCDKFDWYVQCYTLCPDIDSEGNYRSTSPSWGKCS